MATRHKHLKWTSKNLDHYAFSNFLVSNKQSTEHLQASRPQGGTNSGLRRAMAARTFGASTWGRTPAKLLQRGCLASRIVPKPHAPCTSYLLICPKLTLAQSDVCMWVHGCLSNSGSSGPLGQSQMHGKFYFLEQPHNNNNSTKICITRLHTEVNPSWRNFETCHVSRNSVHIHQCLLVDGTLFGVVLKGKKEGHHHTPPSLRTIHLEVKEGTHHF